jgi:protein-disulfide isomerase-like protein with CxxC motif
VLPDEACAKIILTRNPADSYVSWKIAQATGQWKLTNAKNLKTAQVRFDPPSSPPHLARLQAFQLQLMHGLQVSGQTAFYIDYDDILDVQVLNGLAAWLGVEGRLEAVDDTLKKQNPEDIADKV